MKTNNYVYNYGFLCDWMKANPQILRRKLLESLEIQDYGTLGKWINGATMMPMAQMMKFCNAWSVPITAFFFDEQAGDDDIFSPITPQSKIEPDGGWPKIKRKNGMKVCDPRTTVHRNSNLPNYVRTAKTRKYTSNDVQTMVNGTSGKAQTEIPSMERIRYLDIIEKQNEKIDVQTVVNGTSGKAQTEIPSMERMRYLDIIEKQNEKITDLVNEINKLHRQLQAKHNAHYEQEPTVLPMVAENDLIE